MPYFSVQHQQHTSPTASTMQNSSSTALKTNSNCISDTKNTFFSWSVFCLWPLPSPHNFLDFFYSSVTRHGNLTRPDPGTGSVHALFMFSPIHPFVYHYTYSRIKINFKDSKGNLIKTIEANEGDDILSIAHEHDVDLEGTYIQTSSHPLSRYLRASSPFLTFFLQAHAKVPLPARLVMLLFHQNFMTSSQNRRTKKTICSIWRLG